MKKIGMYLWEVIKSFDQHMNVVLGPLLNLFVKEGGHYFGNRDEYISGVFGKNVRLGTCKFCYVMCRLLHLLDKNHCEQSIEEDEENPGRL